MIYNHRIFEERNILSFKYKFLCQVIFLFYVTFLLCLPNIKICFPSIFAIVTVILPIEIDGFIFQKFSYLLWYAYIFHTNISIFKDHYIKLELNSKFASKGKFGFIFSRMNAYLRLSGFNGRWWKIHDYTHTHIAVPENFWSINHFEKRRVPVSGLFYNWKTIFEVISMSNT